jgi:hypothetical protein
MKDSMRRTSVELALSRETLRLCVVADTHSRPHPQAKEHLAALRPDVLLHAGDIGDHAVLDDLAQGAGAPLHAVRGNIDELGLPDVIRFGIGDLTLVMTHIALNGVRLNAQAARLAQAEKAHVVVCGHSHVPFIGKDRGVVVFNPGSIGPRRFHLPIVFGVMDLGPNGLDMFHVDCETGRRWAP